MRSTMLALISVAAMAACGNSTTGTDGSVIPHDMATVQVLPDLVHKPKAKPNCASVFQAPQNNFAAASAATQALFTAIATCLQTTCGVDGVVDGGNATKPCSVEVDGGASGECQTCENNASVNDNITFIDGSMNPIVCQPNTSSPTCRACATEISNCFLDPCNSDADCAGITIGGAATICDVGDTGMCIASP